MSFEPPKNFRILFFNSKIPSRRVKENLKRFGFNDVIFSDDENSVVNTMRGLQPQVIILNHRAWDEQSTPSFIKRLRESLETPVIVWSDELSEISSRLILSCKNAYTLRFSDGFISLTEILQRIEMKAKNPALWV